jgi:hypothetical protein
MDEVLNSIRVKYHHLYIDSSSITKSSGSAGVDWLLMFHPLAWDSNALIALWRMNGGVPLACMRRHGTEMIKRRGSGSRFPDRPTWLLIQCHGRRIRVMFTDIFFNVIHNSMSVVVVPRNYGMMVVPWGLTELQNSICCTG